MCADHIEIEVKFHLTNRSALHARLIAQGVAVQAKTFETNRRYDDRRGRLLARQCLLRLRQDDRARLTFKRPRPEGRGEYKVYDEFEVVVEDFERMHQILGAIGLECVQIYEKRREVFRLQDALICIDQLPIGDFVEIEGRPEAIRAAADQLQLPWERRILANYLHIFETLRQARDLRFRDLTFDNFRDAPNGLEDIIHQFEASAAS